MQISQLSRILQCASSMQAKTGDHQLAKALGDLAQILANSSDVEVDQFVERVSRLRRVIKSGEGS